MNSKNKIIEAFFSLLTIKEFNDINVSMLCKFADIHRTTFYAYYDNLYELLIDAKDYALTKFREELKNINVDKSVDYLSKEYLVPFFDFLKKYPNLFKAYINNANILDSKEIFDTIYKSCFLKRALEYDATNLDLVYKATIFYISGIVALIKDYLNNDCKDNPLDVVNVIVGIRNNSSFCF